MAEELGSSPYDRYSGLRLQFDRLAARPDELMQGAKAMLSGKASALYITDFFMIGVLKRSIDLVSAVRELVLSWNLVAAVPLLRIHLDTLLRVSYVFEESDGEEVARRAFRGEPFNSQRSGSGQRLTDAYLVKRLSKRLHWVAPVYNETNKLVHLSERHIFLSLSEVGDEGSVSLLIERGTSRWSESNVGEVLDCANEITDHLIAYVDAWREWKEQQAPASPASDPQRPDV